MKSKITQAFYANMNRNEEEIYKVGDRVMLNTLHRRREYKNGKKRRVAKFMPRFDGPYVVTNARPEVSTYTLDLPNQPHVFLTYHASQLRRHTENDNGLFLGRKFARPGPVVTGHSEEEWTIEKIVDERRVGRGRQYLVKWVGYGEEENRWLPGRELDDCEVLDIWEGRLGSEGSDLGR
jgi:hypothetical protein